jgi:4-diphosphocytidyl-2-C-methyl-D-erythritol kinase
MFATGRGEVLEPFDIDLSGYTLKVEIPTDAAGNPVAVSTREAYGGIVPREPSLRLREALKLPVEEWRGKVVNDFESTVCPLHPEIPALIADFYARGLCSNVRLRILRFRPF